MSGTKLNFVELKNFHKKCGVTYHGCGKIHSDIIWDTVMIRYPN